MNIKFKNLAKVKCYSDKELKEFTKEILMEELKHVNSIILHYDRMLLLIILSIGTFVITDNFFKLFNIYIVCTVLVVIITLIINNHYLLKEYQSYKDLIIKRIQKKEIK